MSSSDVSHVFGCTTVPGDIARLSSRRRLLPSSVRLGGGQILRFFGHEVLKEEGALLSPSHSSSLPVPPAASASQRHRRFAH
eukprot:746239-Hanusia_phi.AAC.7